MRIRGGLLLLAAVLGGCSSSEKPPDRTPDTGRETLEVQPVSSPEAKYFPIKKGTRWIYATADGDLTVTVEGREKVGDQVCTVFSTQIGPDTIRESYAVTDTGVHLHKVDGRQKADFKGNPVPRLKFGLKKGDTWVWIGQGQEARYEHQGEEEVKVDAGAYTALKISVTAKAQGQESRVTRWYVSGTGLVKEERTAGDNSVVMQLKRFEEGK